jgi:hypothetical protein
MDISIISDPKLAEYSSVKEVRHVHSVGQFPHTSQISSSLHANITICRSCRNALTSHANSCSILLGKPLPCASASHDIPGTRVVAWKYGGTLGIEFPY